MEDTLYSNDGIIEVPRNVHFPNTTAKLVWRNGTIENRNTLVNSFINSANIIEVSDISDFPTPVSGVITLEENTTYKIYGSVDLGVNKLFINSQGSALIGTYRNRDVLKYSGTNELLEIDNVSFGILNLCLKATDLAGKILTANNYTLDNSDYNYGRTEVLDITNCEIRNTTNLWTITGFELVDIANTLIWYISGGTSAGCEFRSIRHLEITSCEVYNWYEEGTSPASNHSLLNQFEIIDNIDATVPVNPTPIGNGVVNINSSIIHPEITQDGLKISPLSTTGFGTLASNTFVDTNLTTGVLANFDYDVQNTYIIQANQGISNGNAKGTMTLTGNSVKLDNSVTNPIVFAEASTVGGGGFTSPIVFPIATRVGTSVANCSFTYNSKIDANFFVTVNATVEQSGNAFITLRLRANGTAITSSVGKVEIKSGVATSVSFSVIGQATLGDVFDIEVESSTNTDVLVSELSLNGYQF